MNGMIFNVLVQCPAPPGETMLCGFFSCSSLPFSSFSPSNKYCSSIPSPAERVPYTFVVDYSDEYYTNADAYPKRLADINGYCGDQVRGNIPCSDVRRCELN